VSPHLRLRGVHITSFPALEDLVFSLLSFAVVATLLSALVAPPTAAVAATVTGIQPMAGGKKQIIVYGTLVDPSGTPISGASIAVYDSSGVLQDTSTTNSSGAFNLIRFKDTGDTFTFKITVTVNGQPVTGTYKLAMTPGYKWGLRVVFTPPTTFAFVPIPGY
jgi:hypothetical protein